MDGNFRPNDLENPIRTGVEDNLLMAAHTGTDTFCSRERQTPFVSTEMLTASGMDDIASRLKKAREAAGFESASAAAKAMGVTVSTYVSHENGTRGFPASRAERYARFLRVRPEWLLYGTGGNVPAKSEPQLTMLPVLAQIRAGQWLAVDDYDQGEAELMSAALDSRYPHAPQWLREVQGDSMNGRNINPGDYAHIVDFGEAGVALQTGMVVEVTRFRDGSSLREITLKEAEVDAAGVTLWPRSTNPRWKDPVILEVEDGSDIEVRVTGLLLAVIRRF